jgi:hypothetical protein
MVDSNKTPTNQPSSSTGMLSPTKSSISDIADHIDVSGLSISGSGSAYGTAGPFNSVNV